MNNTLIKYIKKMKGTTLGIGIENDKVKESLEKNNEIKTCFLLEENKNKIGKKNLKSNTKLKKVNIKKIKKVFKYKRIENIICNYKTISPFLKNFVKDSVYINSGKIFIYGKGECDDLVQKYKRYTSKIKIEKKDDEFLLIIDIYDIKNKPIKEIGYYLIDLFENILNILTNILVN